MLQNFDDNVHVSNGELSDQFIKEFAVEPTTGIGSVSRRGVARLSGVRYQTWGQGDSIFTKKVDEYLAQYGFQGDSIFDDEGRVLDIPASLVIKYYAYQGNEVAQRTDMALGAVGLRVKIQESLGWQPKPKRLTKEQIIEICTLPQSTTWDKRFDSWYYDELARLTKLKPIKNKRPARWAQLTKEFVYDLLPEGIYDQLRANRTKTESSDKLHQFLSDEGIDILQKHFDCLGQLMPASASLTELRRSIYQVKTRSYQLDLYCK